MLLGILLYFVLALVLRTALAQPLDQVGGGTLLLQDSGGEWVPAPVLSTRVDARVTGMMAEISVTQGFRNDSGRWIEALYAFPLPDDAAVNRMVLRIGDRRIEGEIKEKQDAVRTYRSARAAGQTASLVTQQRPNLFTTRAANIAPGETVGVEISYVQQLPFRDGGFTLRFPMTLTARFAGDAEGARGGLLPGEVEADASHVQLPAGDPAGPTVDLRLHLRPGFDLVRLESRYHDIEIAESNGLYQVALAEGAVPADRDFELVWEPALKAAPSAALLSERHGDHDYALLMVLPPQAAHQSSQPRELILIIDTSGSMQGRSIVQAKDSLMMAIGSLRPEDRFNVIEFNSAARALFERPLPADPDALLTAHDWIAGLEADGGTHMAPALVMALDGAAPADHVRQVVFVTDGSVGNEVELFRLIEQRLGDARLFTVGIGAAPNSYFMRKAAEFGRGSYTFIGDLATVTEKMDALLARLEYPALTDLCLDWPVFAETYPARLPDLYRGEPLVVAARLERMHGDVEVCGQDPAGSWNRWLPLKAGDLGSGVSTLWARRKIEHLMDDLALGGDPTATRSQVLDVALTHRLVSRYTAFVAVDQTPQRSQAARLARTRVANHVPANLNLPVSLPQTGTDSMGRISFGLALLLMAWVFALRLRGDAI